MQPHEFRYTHPSDYSHRTCHFSDYKSFKAYHDQKEPSLVHQEDKGLHQHIQNIADWIISTSNKAIKSFHAEWEYVISSQTEYETINILEQETTFHDKPYMQYLSYLLSHDENYASDPKLLSITDQFAIEALKHTNITRLLQREPVSSFGGGIGFGFQVFCDDKLLLDAGAGNGGGYDTETLCEYGGGGGIQINNASIGGGTGSESDYYKVDPESNIHEFFHTQLPHFMHTLTHCHSVKLQSGGGSGAGFTDKENRTNLVEWSYYDLQIEL